MAIRILLLQVVPPICVLRFLVAVALSPLQISVRRSSAAQWLIDVKWIISNLQMPTITNNLCIINSNNSLRNSRLPPLLLLLLLLCPRPSGPLP